MVRSNGAIVADEDAPRARRKSACLDYGWASAANAAVDNGVVVVAASGNEANANAMGSPACGSKVIAVGATYKDDYPNCEDGTSTFNWSSCTDNSPALDDLVCFSNNSSNLDVVAPGAVVLSASNAAGGSSITGKSGTSMSSPAVAGLAALLLDLDATLTPAAVRQHLRDGAIDMGPAGFDVGYGYGRIDVINTLQLVTPCNTDPDCDDGQFCNGAETCNAGSCQPGSDPCPGQSCDEASDQCVASPSVVYEWTMDTDPGWTTQGQWAWGQPAGGGGQHGGPDPTSGATGANVVGYNLNGDYANNLPETHLTTTAIDCSNLINVSLRFQRWLGVETPTYDHAYVRVSNDGANWTTIWENSAEVADSTWVQQEFDISAIADGQQTLFVRWTMGTTDSSWQYCGWNVDDVQIIATDLGGGATCSDGVQNQGEDRIDCGGPCPACSCLADAECDDALFCNGGETCDAFGNCQAGTAADCDDGVGCTDDTCNEATNSCDNTPNDANCPDDGLFCNGAESCDVTADCASAGDPCGGGEVCNETTDVCDPGQTGEGFILSRNPDFSTDDRSFNRNETLYMLVWTDQVDFNDINRARWELRDPGGTRIRQPLTNHFDGSYSAAFALSGLPSNANDWEWKGEVKDNAGNRYKPTDFVVVSDAPQCGTDADCDDGLYCNGSETCSAGSCLAGTPVDCNDGVGCTDDTCNEATDSCDSTANDTNCDNGLYCDGAETCDAILDCRAGTPIDCNDGVACTDDSCNNATAACDNAANDTNCDDGQFCNGAETCDPALDCQADSDPCGGGACDEANDFCVECSTDPDCDDGLFCTGTETCSAGQCQAGSDPCGAGFACNETTQTCDPGMIGEGYILSVNSDFSTDDRVFNRNDTIYMKMWTDVVDFNDIDRARWELKDPDGNRIRQPLTNHFDGTYTATFDLSGLPSNATDWTWKGEVRDNAENRYKPTDAITVLP